MIPEENEQDKIRELLKVESQEKEVEKKEGTKGKKLERK